MALFKKILDISGLLYLVEIRVESTRSTVTSGIRILPFHFKVSLCFNLEIACDIAGVHNFLELLGFKNVMCTTKHKHEKTGYFK